MSLGNGTGLSFARHQGASLDLSFVGGATLDSRVTFSRGSHATVVRSSGLIDWADHNLLQYSEQFDNVYWTRLGAAVSGGSINATTAPDGTLTADKAVEDSSVGILHVGFRRTFTSVASAYTFSVYVKAAERSTVMLLAMSGGGVTYCSADFNLAAATATIRANNLSIVATISDAGNGWYRCSISYVDPGGASAYVDTRMSDSAASSGGTGDQYDGDGSSGMYFWGAQLEYGSTARTYRQTTSAAFYGARFDYNPSTLAPLGLLIEEQRTNLLTYSQDLSTGWTKDGAVTVTTGQTDPMGGANAILAAGLNTFTIGSGVVWSALFAVSAGADYTLTIYVKPSTSGTVSLGFAEFNAVPASTANTYSHVVVTAGGGWQRITVSVTTNALTTQMRCVIGENGAGTLDCYLWGAQLEAGSFATSYIPTVAASVVRSADSATMTGTNFSNWYTQTEGTFVTSADVSATTTDATARGFWAAGDPTLAFGSAEVVYMNRPVSSAAVLASLYDGGIAQISSFDGGGTASPGVVLAQAFAYKANDFAVSFEGGAVEADATGTIPTPTAFSIGSLASAWSGGGGYLCGHIRSIRYWPRRLDDGTLKALSGG